MRGSAFALSAVGVSTVLATVAMAGGLHEGDIILSISDDQLVTGTVAEPVRLFAATFGDIGCDAFTSNPGYDAFPGSFPLGSSIGWDAVDGLRIWNGAGFEPTDVEFIRVSFGSQEFDIGDGPVSGFSLFVQADGGFHKHVDLCMQGCPQGCAPPVDADPGVYLVNLIVKSSDPDIADSEPYWILFDYLADPGEVEAAAAWAEANLPARFCAPDLDGSGSVDFNDLLALLAAWGDCPARCAADLDGSGAVDFNDLLTLLATWGPCA